MIMTTDGNNPKSSRRRRFLKRLLVTGLIAAPTLAYGHSVEPNELEVVRTYFPIKGWPSGKPPLKIGYLCDFHCETDESVARAGRSAQMLMGEHPDIVLLGGDYVTHHGEPWGERCATAIACVASAPLGAFGVLGNHDWWSARAFQIIAALRQVGITIFNNQSMPITGYDPLWLVTLDDYTVNETDLPKAMEGVPANAIKLLLIHEPDWADLAPPGFALQISGHSHAGQVRIFGRPIITPPLGTKYPQGLQQAKNHPVYTSRGVGMMGVNIRIGCRPEVTLITVGP